ncbi:hypothetical protein ARALYDRAFT_898369 [Arabidopsis lyrata subsp. lyrata]|uniref:DNA mismatch repair proteins mutS family domain-containing protein n=1 Tax=Arabidopsis lyrata subsp. lyrata TaxID=81972 RepID=D7LA35_ARALL|nr:hypothetical protein ARALYDRAFT_898369 [Arabidopsis lyrata subsp. lyrata]
MAKFKIFEVGVSESLGEHMRRFNLDIIEKAGLCISTELDYVYELVIGVIDVTRSKERGYQTLVKEGFCAELDELRQIYEELPEFLQEVSAKELEHFPHSHKEKLPPCIVYIFNKLVALLVFLSHIGSFVPADATTIGLTDSKFMTAEQSTFMKDLHQGGMMLRQATSRSVCLLDEFGKGTLTEGEDFSTLCIG